MTQAYPLQWPQGHPRTKSHRTSQFRTSIAGALNNVNDELRRFGKDTGHPISNLVISSNVTLGQQRPTDPGVAVYFRWDKIDGCIAVDRYPKVEDNLQAIAKILEAERAKMRHGGLNIVRAGFRGYAALPPPENGTDAIEPPWRDVLGLPSGVGIDAAEARYREIVKREHPDRGGDAAKFNLATNAIRAARQECG